MTKALTTVLAIASILLAAPRVSHAQQAQVKNPHGDLKEACASCHSAKAWAPAVITPAFKHAPKVFPLEGAHASANCKACHASLDFKGVSTKCAVCHKDVHQGELGSDCSICHSPRSFVDRSRMVQAHQTTRFPLTGAHVLTDCLSCHPPVAQGHMSFVGRSVECFACHVAAYDATTNPPHKSSGFPTQCEACHTTIEWGTATFDHNATQFPLTGAHQAVLCSQCHASGVYKGLSIACVSCHLDKYNQTTTPAHAAANFPQDCTICHTTATWTGATFNHLMTWPDYTGAHVATACSGCHSDNVYKGKPITCISCHTTNFNATTDPPHSSASFQQTCQDCHGTVNFTTSTWKHPTNLFQFTGAHVGLDCLACHTTGVYKGLGTTCVTCHMANFNATTTPVHTTAGYGTNCEACHSSTTSWLTASFNHIMTWPDYTGAHPAVACATCHSDNVYKGKSTLCSSCHVTATGPWTAEYNGTTDPPHAKAAFATTCNTCHTTTNFTTTTWVHPTTLFPDVKTGAHVGLDCLACHTTGLYKGLGATCATCHLSNFNATTDPIHSKAGFAQTCQTCHSTVNFTSSTWKHPTNLFTFTGAHVGLDCLACHSSGIFVGLGTTCVTCHKAQYDTTSTPSHTTAGYGTNCESCHSSTTTWGGAAFNHLSTWPDYTGAHPAVACATCHSDNVYKGKSILCSSCHVTATGPWTPEYNGTTDPPHAKAAFATTCNTCHTTTNFTTTTWVHPTTLFPDVKTGAHVGLDCLACHTTGVYKGLGTTCVTCHLSNFNATTDPIHSKAGFAQTCQTCHGTVNFTSSTWVHPTNLFQFTGAHVGLDCNACHSSGTFVGLGTTCVTCHKAQYDTTSSPSHTTAGYSTSCESCHSSTINWGGAVFNHLSTWPDYTGAHPAVACATCHSDNVYKGKSILCSSCHVTATGPWTPEYNGTTDPPHAKAAFATTCNTCHTTTNFTTTSWVHPTTLFPDVKTGAHVGLDCLACHTTGVYKGLGTTCVTCHLSNFNATTDPIHSKAGFANTCQTCHSTVNFTSATWTHPTNLFISVNQGAHLGLDCNACHASGTFVGLGTTCVTCHKAQYDTTSSPSHTTAGYSTSCESCHSSTTTWGGAVFNHLSTWPDYTGAHPAVACATCHSDNVYKGKSILCSSCHVTATGPWTPEYNGTTDPPHAKAAFATTCNTCHTTTNFTTTTWVHPTTLFPDVKTGAHVGLDCLACHTTGVYKGLGTTCVTCHLTNFNATTDPIHSKAGFAQTCQTCHSTVNFTSSTWVHPTNLFQFTGAHVGLDCNACHKSGIFVGLGTTCVTCHKAQYDTTTAPSHTSAGYGTNCESCHSSTINWGGAVFNHLSTWSDYTGAHPAVACATCHSDNVYKGKSTLCSSCHVTATGPWTPEYNITKDPPHAKAAFATTCNTCHTTTNFTTSSWVHPATLFPDVKTGAHVGLDCLACHTTGVYVGLGTTCITCHQTDYNNTNNPPHASAGFNTTCTTCHNTNPGWGVTTGFNTYHTWFPYNHHSSTCAQCHPTNYTTFSCRGCHGNTHNKNYTDAQCYSCHPKGNS